MHLSSCQQNDRDQLRRVAIFDNSSAPPAPTLPPQTPPPPTTTAVVPPTPPARSGETATITVTPCPSETATPAPTSTSTPTPTPMTDIPWRYQNNKAVYPAVPVSEEEVKLTVVMTFSESSNGTHSEESQQMLAWTYFNKKAINMPGHEMFDVLSSMSSAWDILNDSSAVIQGVGRSMPSDREGKRAWMLDIYEMYYDRTFTANGERFRNVVNPNVRNVKDLWQTYGSNSAIDPTYGGTAYFHQDDPLQYPTIEDRFTEIRRNFYGKALVDSNSIV